VFNIFVVPAHLSPRQHPARRRRTTPFSGCPGTQYSRYILTRETAADGRKRMSWSTLSAQSPAVCGVDDPFRVLRVRGLNRSRSEYPPGPDACLPAEYIYTRTYRSRTTRTSFTAKSTDTPARPTLLVPARIAPHSLRDQPPRTARLMMCTGHPPNGCGTAHL
jgi:hypothetical protein